MLRRFAKRRTQIALFGSMSLLCMIVTAVLAVQVFVKLDRFGSTAIDNIQWTMSQLEVEQIKLVSALELLQEPTEENVANAKQRFDILYSRAVALRDGSAYRKALAGTAADDQLAIVDATLRQMAAIVDRTDQDIMDAREVLLEAALSLNPTIRRLSSEGITIGANMAQAERDSLTNTLFQMAVMSLLMISGMVSLMWLLWRLYVLYRRRALQNRITLKRLSTILDTSEDAILVVRPNGLIVDANKAASAMFGPLSLDDRTQGISRVLWRREDDGSLSTITGERLRNSCKDGPNRCARLVARRQDGTLIPVELSASLAARSGDEVCVCFIRDISERLEAEAQVQAAQDKALLGERAKAHFLGRMSHEMRTPLHGILGTLDLLDSTPLSPEQARYTGIMKSSGQVLLNQIDDALDITRTSGDAAPLVNTVFNVEQLIEDIAASQRPVADANGNRIDLRRHARPVGDVLGDRDRVHQIVLNLLSNAIKFTRNGEVSIEAARIGASKNGENIVEIQVCDTGIGISESDIDRIFDDFVRLTPPDGRRVEGTGLGLGIARGLVSLLGGEIGVESLVGEGSVFWIRLPLRSAVSDDISERSGDQPKVVKAIEPMDILVIEDNPTNSYVLQVMIEKQGHRVSHARDGESGVTLAETTRFDVIVMDINMPGMDGGEATHCIRMGTGASAGARIVALSAYIDANTRERLINSGVDDVRTKPLRMAELNKLLTGEGRTPGAQHREKLDPTITKQLRSILSEDLFNQLVQGLTEESSSLLKALESIDLVDMTQLAMQLHRVAGVAATVGAVAVRDVLCRAEAAASAGNKRMLEAELLSFSDTWEETLQELRSLDKAA